MASQKTTHIINTELIILYESYLDVNFHFISENKMYNINNLANNSLHVIAQNFLKKYN